MWARPRTSAATRSIDAFGLRLVEGRDFLDEEVTEVRGRLGIPYADTVILTRQLAARLLPDASSAVGKTVYLGGETRPMRVVGVVDTLQSPGAETTDDAYDSFIMPLRHLDDSAALRHPRRAGASARGSWPRPSAVSARCEATGR